VTEFTLIAALTVVLFLVWASSVRKTIQAEREAMDKEKVRVRNSIQAELDAHRLQMDLMRKERLKERRKTLSNPNDLDSPVIKSRYDWFHPDLEELRRHKSVMDMANARRMQRESDKILKSFCGIDMARLMGGRRGFYFGQHHPGDHSFSDLMKRLNDDSSL
tara:strand:+ start:210 stop:695 length:486 start_codon:yes stop_codon:yes gene_type:complete